MLSKRRSFGSILIALLFMPWSTAAQELSTAQMDEIIAKAGAHTEEFQKFAAIAQQVYFTRIIEDPKSGEERSLSAALGHDIWGDTHLHWTYYAGLRTAPSLQSKLEDAAKRSAEKFDPIKIRGTWIDVGISVGLAGATAATGYLTKNPKAAQTAGILAPAAKEGIIRYFEREAEKPNFPITFTTEFVKFGINECRLKTEIGKALESLCLSLHNGGFLKNEPNDPAVVSAKALIAARKNEKKVEEILRQIGVNPEKLADTVEKLPVVTSPPAANEEWQRHRDETVASLQNISGGLRIAEAAFKIAGSDKDAAVASALADATGGLANLAQNAATMAPMMVAGGYVAIGLAAITAIQASQQKKESPYPVLFQMLFTINKKIDDLREEMRRYFENLDSDLQSQFARGFQYEKAIKGDTSEIRRALSDVQKSLREIEAKVDRGFKDIAAIELAAEDRECFRRTGTGHYLPLQTRENFIGCRDIYIRRATDYARSELARTGEIEGVLRKGFVELAFPYASRYEELRQLVDPNHAVFQRSLSHPGVWTTASRSLVGIIAANPKRFRDIGVEIEGPHLVSRDLDPVIESGKDLEDFIARVAIDNSNGSRKLKAQAFSLLFDRIFAGYDAAIDRVQAALENFPVKLDPAGGPDQAINVGFKYKFLNEPIPFCEKVTPKVTSFDVLYFTKFGGSHGLDTFFGRASLSPELYQSNLNILQGSLDALDRGKLRFDASVLAVLPRPPLLAEQIRLQEATVSVCFRRFEISDFTQSAAEMRLTYHAEVEVSLTTDTPTGKYKRVVQILNGSFPVKLSPAFAVFANLHGNNVENRFGSIVMNGWQSLMGKFSQFSVVPDEAANQKLVESRESLRAHLRSLRSEATARLREALAEDDRAIQKNRQQLEALTLVGLNAMHPAVGWWIGALKSGHIDADAKTFVEMAFDERFPRTPADLRAIVAVSKQKMTSALNELASAVDLTPPVTPIAEQVRQLERLRIARAKIQN